MLLCYVLKSFNKGDDFPGLLGLVYAYLETLDVESGALAKIEKYLDLIRRRANGTCVGIVYNIVLMFNSRNVTNTCHLDQKLCTIAS